VPTGNTYDKYNSRNPVVRRLMAGFERNLDDLFDAREPAVGARRRLRRGRPDAALGGALGAGARRRHRPRRPASSRPSGRSGRAEPRVHRPCAPSAAVRDGEFDLACAIEVLEHVPTPAHTLAEMARCAARHLLVSVPREPLWRALNMARGAYLRELGNTPGTSTTSPSGDRRAARRARRGDRDALAVPLDDGARPASDAAGRLAGLERAAGRRAAPRERAFASGARMLSIGIASTGVFTFAYFALASHVL
jgi:hypothetical protein